MVPGYMSYVYRRKSGDRVYLEERESYRVKGKVRNRFVRYLGAEGATPGVPRRELDRVLHGDSRRAGAVRLLWALAGIFAPTLGVYSNTLWASSVA